MKFERVQERDMRFFCNAEGEPFASPGEDAFPDEDGILRDERIPKPLRDIYNNAWSDDYGLLCYVAVVEGEPCLLLNWEFFKPIEGKYPLGEGDDGAQYLSLMEYRMLLYFVQRLLHSSAPELEGVTVILPEDCENPFCQWEMSICIPAEKATNREYPKKVCEAVLREHSEWIKSLREDVLETLHFMDLDGREGTV